ncbi:MAG: ATP-grasp domain-containing protein [Gemmatales bacterium]|nr:ATP-grasp domain-containing protein [Gemmatales bacterium]MDW8387815.1 ATP-grasp domain-containing protein [Gemmatales bacterium]
MQEERTVILVGASVRAAAFSAMRRGGQPWCLDLFGDADLRRLCPVRVVPRHLYPQGIPQMVADLAPLGTVQYTGGLENHPRIVARLARLRSLWGNGPDTLRAVRHPGRLAEVLGENVAPLTFNLTDVPRDGSWLAKPIRGCGGKGIEPVTASTQPRQGWYYQQFQPGKSVSVVYLADAPNGCRLLGATWQLVGESWLHAKPFAYCGSLGPMRLNGEQVEKLLEIGRRLHQSFTMVGYFGVDAIVLPDGRFRVVEVNPRFTASVEVIEYAQQLRLASREQNTCLGKAILFASKSLQFPEQGPWMDVLAKPPAIEEPPEYADIPMPGTMIGPGQPILTLFAKGDSEEHCRRELRRKAEMLDRWLYDGKMLERL